MAFTDSSIFKAIRGDESEEVIKAGTLATTRAIGVVAAGLIAVLTVLDKAYATGWWHDTPVSTKLWFVLGSGAIWAIVASADAIARGLAQPRIISLPSGLKVTRTEKKDDPGWHAVAVQAGGDTPDFLVVKGTEIAWVSAADLAFP